MRKLMTIVVAMLVVLALVAGGIGGDLWYNTKQQVDQLIAMVRPFATVSYGSITILPVGSVGVSQLRIMPTLVNDSISIGAIRLNAPNILALLNIRRQLSQGQLPEALSISLRDFELPLHGGILSAKPAAPGAGTPFDNLEALGCGPILHFGGAEWQAMGYNNFISNIEIGYRNNTQQNMLNLQVDSSTRNWATLNLDLGLALTGSTESVIAFASAVTPKLAKLDFVLRDDGFNARKNNYCAAKAGKPIPDYIADHVRLVTERLRANGVDPGPGLIEAYRRYLTEGGEITITAAPPAPINPAEIPSYTAADAIKLLGLKVKVNQTVIADPSVNWDAAKVARALDAGRVQPEEPSEPVPPPPPPKPVIIQRSFHPTPVGDLSQHIGKIVKLKTVTGVDYRGRVEAVIEGGMVRVRINKPGGSATLVLKAGDLASAEVLY